MVPAILPEKDPRPKSNLHPTATAQPVLRLGKNWEIRRSVSGENCYRKRVKRPGSGRLGARRVPD